MTLARLTSAALGLGLFVRSLGSQDAPSPLLQLADATGPRFVAEAPGNRVDAPEVDVRNAAVFLRRITIDLNRASVATAIDEIARRAGLQITFSPNAVAHAGPISLTSRDITVGAALTAVLFGVGLDVQLARDGSSVALVGRGSGTATVARRRQGAGTVMGHATDGKTGQGLLQVTVAIEGTGHYARTDAAGRYSMSGVPAGLYRVTAHVLGYAPLTKVAAVVPDSSTQLDFTLTAIAATLGQVVTTVTGPQQKLEVGNTIGTIAVADSVVGTAPVTNLSDVISARVPGVQVYLNGGISGSSPQINIRGQNSLTLSNQPLLYIDGARVENSIGAFSNVYVGGTNEGEVSGRFNDLDPNEIQSIEVVKGPSAATLYGTDAANGVILVTTKHGTSGHARWSAYGEGGPITLTRGMFWEAFTGWGHAPGSTTPITCGLTDVAAHTCVQDSITHFSPFKDPALSPIGTGSHGEYGLQVAGGTGTMRYFLSGTLASETNYLQMPSADLALAEAERGAIGVSPDERHPNGYQRASGRQTLTTDLGATADATVSVGVQSQQSRIPDVGYFYLGAAGAGYRDANAGWYPGDRPVNSFLIRNDESATHFTGSVAPTWRPASWLSTHGTVGLDFSSDYLDVLGRPGEGPPGQNNGGRANGKRTTTLATVDLGATATGDLSTELTLKTSVGVQYNRRADLSNVAQAGNLAPGAETVAGGAIPQVTESNVESVVEGAYAQEELDIGRQLFVTGAARFDGGSTFGRNFRTAVYPKASLSWVVSDAPFWHIASSVLSTLRLRAAFGASGVQPPVTAAVPEEQLAPTFANGAVITGAILAQAGNPSLKPERQQEFEGGFDADALHERVHVEATLYTKRSTDALLTVSLPASIGGRSVTENIGAVRNFGYETLVTLALLESRPLAWTVTANGSVNHNRLVTLGAGQVPQYAACCGYASSVPGEPLFSYWDYPILSYQDANHDGIIEPNEVVVGSTRAYKGSEYPGDQWTVASTLSLLADRIRLGTQFDYRGGNTVVNTVEGFRSFYNNRYAQFSSHASLADQARTVAALSGADSFTLWGFGEDGSFTRWRELSLTFNAPDRVAHTLRARTLSLVLSARNLRIWTRYGGLDPEVNTYPGTTNLGSHTDIGGMPTPQYWLVRINAGW